MRNHINSSSLFIVLLVILVSCNKDYKTIQDAKVSHTPVDKNEIVKMVNDCAALYEKGDVKGFADIYSTDAVVLAPDKNPIVSKSKISDWYNEAFKNGTNGFTIKTDSVWTDDNLMASDGTWSMSSTNDNWEVHGKFVWLWKKESNKWKVFRDIFNVEQAKK